MPIGSLGYLHYKAGVMYNGYVPDPSLVEGERPRHRPRTFRDRYPDWPQFRRFRPRHYGDDSDDDDDNDGDDDRGNGRALARSDDAQDPVEELDVSHAYEHQPINNTSFVSLDQRSGVHEILPQPTGYLFHTASVETELNYSALTLLDNCPQVPWHSPCLSWCEGSMLAMLTGEFRPPLMLGDLPSFPLPLS